MNIENQTTNVDFYRILYENGNIGKSKSISAEQLMQIIGTDNKRDFHFMLERARKGGQIIINTGNGYYIAENDAEIEQFVRYCVARGIANFEICKSARQWLKIRKEHKNGYKQLSFTDLEILLTCIDDMDATQIINEISTINTDVVQDENE